MSEQILLVEDEDAVADFIVTTLQREGYKVTRVSTGAEALSCLQRQAPDLVLLDLMLPGGMDGFQVCQAMRGSECYTPIIMVTNKSEDIDKIIGLELGADDYIAKPFNIRELLARVRAALRLFQSGKGTQHREWLRIGPLQIDLAGRQAQMENHPVSLTPKEFDLLVILVRNQGRVFGRESLLQQVWGYEYVGDSRTVDVHIQRLRRKLEPDPGNPRYLLTVHGIGYKFVAREEG